MSMIYFIITCICAVISAVCYQINWIYSRELFYVALFITGIFFALIFVQQEDNVNKKYRVFSPRNIIYFLLVTAVLIYLKDFDIKDYETVRNSFIKLATIINAITAGILILFNKIRHFYYNF